MTLPPPYRPLSELHLLSVGSTSWFLNSGRNLAFHSYLNESPLYTLSIKNHAPCNELTLRSGDDKKAKSICTAQEKVELGEYVIAGMKGEERFEKAGTDSYMWDVPAALCAPPGAAPDQKVEGEARKKFLWKRFPRVEKKEATFASPDWKLTDLQTGEVHAVFVEKWDGTKERGQVQFRRSYGVMWEMSVLVTVGIVSERVRAKRGQRGSFTKGLVLW